MSPNGSSGPASQALQHAILQTLKYSDHFDFPLTISELSLRLIGTKSSISQLKLTLGQLLADKAIFKSGDYYYYLPRHQSIVKHRLLAQDVSLKQLKKAQTIATKLGKIPGVKAIYLTGSLAMLNSSPNSDIDFMVITESHKLWTTRFLLTIYTSLIGRRRTPSTLFSRDKLCLNLYLSESSYQLPKSKQSLYSAYELVQAKPLVDPSNTRSELLAANPWIKTYLPQAISQSVIPPSSKTLQKGQKTGLLEVILFQLQYLYMKRKITREYITQDSAFFHPNNPAPKL